MGRTRKLMTAVGAAFLAAAVLKAWAVLAVPSFAPGWFATPAVQLGIAQVEAFLGLWLCSGRLPRAACLIALGTFLCFAGVNFYQGLNGQTSCGCFGQLRVNPWYVLILDTAAVVALAFALKGDYRRAAQSGAMAVQVRQALGRAAAIGAGAAVLLAVLSGGAVASFGSFDAALAYLRGETLAVEPGEVDAGPAPPRASRPMTIELRNWSDRPVTFLGGVDDCACWVTKDLPVAVPAGERRTISIQVNYPPSPRRFRRAIDLITNNSRQTTVRFFLSGTCVGPDEDRQAQQGDQP